MQKPEAIPVYPGDDWSFSFSYQEPGDNGAPVVLDGLVCTLYAPYTPEPILLTGSSGEARPDQTEGDFTIWAFSALTSGLKVA